jgi:hypothetical protein
MTSISHSSVKLIKALNNLGSLSGYAGKNGKGAMPSVRVLLPALPPG